MKNSISNLSAEEFVEYTRLKGKIVDDDYSQLSDEEIDRLIELVEIRDFGEVRTKRLPKPDYKKTWERYVAAHPDYKEVAEAWADAHAHYEWVQAARKRRE